jgi:hypothetical protein
MEEGLAQGSERVEDGVRQQLSRECHSIAPGAQDGRLLGIRQAPRRSMRARWAVTGPGQRTSLWIRS